MTSKRSTLRRDQRGATMIEMAIALPVLILFIYGIFVVGLLFQANAGMQHALGEAARYATIFPTPTDSQLQARVTSKKFGTDNGTLGTPSITTNAAGGYKEISLTYSQPTDFLFFTGPTVSITRSKRVYLAS